MSLYQMDLCNLEQENNPFSNNWPTEIWKISATDLGKI